MPARKRLDWKKAALRLAALVPLDRLHPDCRDWFAVHQRDKCLVAFSGGADSVALLLLLWAHAPLKRNGLRAAHFNHRLRGRASTADRSFCQRVCRALGVTLKVGEWKEASADASEADARRARHAFFREQIRSLGATALCLGHQQDDIAETMLMRLARGSGTSGLAAPRPVHVMSDHLVHLRPLLGMKKAEIVAALRNVGAVWREDETNASGYFLRNRIRHRVVRAWTLATEERDALAGAALSRELLEEDDAALEAWVQAIAPFNRNGTLDLTRLNGKPKAVVRRALHRWLLSTGFKIQLSRQAFSALLDDVIGRRITQHSIGPGLFAKISASGLALVNGSEKCR